MNRRVLPVLMTMLFLFALAAGVVQGQSGEEVTFQPVTDFAMGFTALEPEGWMQAGAGAYRRMASESDLTTVIQQAALGFTADGVAQGLLQQLGLDGLPEESTVYETDALTWDVYTFALEIPNVGEVGFHLALSALERPLVTYLVLVQAVGDEYEALYDSLMVPLLDGFAPFSLNWGQPDGPTAIEEVDPLRLTPEVLSVIPHDAASWTQGLIYHEGSLYESDGNCCPSYSRQSSLREVDPLTGEVLRAVDIPAEYFAEGLERVDDRLIMLTWQENTALVFDLETFEQVDSYSYEGEGWGLCADDDYLYMSDGSAFISLRDKETFELVDRGVVTFMGRIADNINELECVGDYIYANIWQTDVIIQIDKTNGNVVSVVDTTDLLNAARDADVAIDEDAMNASSVLNGIVYLPESETFLLTGKQWPFMFEVNLVEMEIEAEAGGE
jgi:glutamine cyclotransferase